VKSGSDREYLGTPERLPSRLQAVRRLPTRMARSAWGRPRPRLEKVGTSSSSSPGLDARRGEGMNDPDLRRPGCGSVYAVFDEWLWHPPEGQWAHLLAGTRDAEGARYMRVQWCPPQLHLQGGGSHLYRNKMIDRNPVLNVKCTNLR
jgi:hypothetical protein